MAPKRLVHHLRSYRKSIGLSQHELASLLGCRSGAKVSRYEHFKRVPSIQAGIAYEVIFHERLRSLFPGMYAKVEGNVARHAKKLLERQRAQPKKSEEAKVALLRSLAGTSEERS
jgi:transcriptional regulator with XRE-family HTH domain